MREFKKILFLIGIISIFGTSLLVASQDLSVQGKKNLRSANIHLGGGRHEKALPLYEMVLEENPNQIDALNNVAAIYYDFEVDYPQAREFYVRLIDVINNVFAEYEEMKLTDEKAAKKFFKENIKKPKLEDMLPNVIKLRKSCWVKMFQDAQKETDYDIALEKFLYIYSFAPDSINTVKMLAFTFNKLGNAEKTLEYQIIAAEMNLEDDMSRTMIGNTYYQEGNYEEAIKWYKSAAEINDENLDNFYNMALSFDNLQDDENAIKSYLKVYELDQMNINAIISISNKYAKLGKIDESLDFLKKAVELDPSNIEFVETLCWKLSNEKRFEELLTYATKWKELVPDSKNAADLVNLAKKMKK